RLTGNRRSMPLASIVETASARSTLAHAQGADECMLCTALSQESCRSQPGARPLACKGRRSHNRAAAHRLAGHAAERHRLSQRSEKRFLRLEKERCWGSGAPERGISRLLGGEERCGGRCVSSGIPPPQAGDSLAHMLCCGVVQCSPVAGGWPPAQHEEL